MFKQQNSVVNIALAIMHDKIHLYLLSVISLSLCNGDMVCSSAWNEKNILNM